MFFILLEEKMIAEDPLFIFPYFQHREIPEDARLDNEDLCFTCTRDRRISAEWTTLIVTRDSLIVVKSLKVMDTQEYS